MRLLRHNDIHIDKRLKSSSASLFAIDRLCCPRAEEVGPPNFLESLCDSFEFGCEVAACRCLFVPCSWPRAASSLLCACSLRVALVSGLLLGPYGLDAPLGELIGVFPWFVFPGVPCFQLSDGNRYRRVLDLGSWISI